MEVVLVWIIRNQSYYRTQPQIPVLVLDYRHNGCTQLHIWPRNWYESIIFTTEPHQSVHGTNPQSSIPILIERGHHITIQRSLPTRLRRINLDQLQPFVIPAQSAFGAHPQFTITIAHNTGYLFVGKYQITTSYKRFQLSSFRQISHQSQFCTYPHGTVTVFIKTTDTTERCR